MKCISATLLLISSFWMIVWLNHFDENPVFFVFPIIQLCISAYLYLDPLLKNGKKNW